MLCPVPSSQKPSPSAFGKWGQIKIICSRLCRVSPSQQRSPAAFPCVFSLKADRIARFLSSVDRPADFPMDDACWAAQILCSFFGSGTPIPPATGTPAFLLSSRVFVVALPPNVKPAQQPAPALHESNLLRFTGCMKRINVVPVLQRRSPSQVLRGNGVRSKL